MPLKKIYASGLAAILLSGCTTTAPYPTRYQAKDIDAPPATVDCDNHADKHAVLGCLKGRAQGWERKAAHIRSQGYLAGSFAIPAAGTAIGLAAEHDPNHAVSPLGLLTGALITHTSNYANNDQAAVAETAVSAYGCLIKQAGDWQGELYGALRQAGAALHTDQAILRTDISDRRPPRPQEPAPPPSAMTVEGKTAALNLRKTIQDAVNDGDNALAGIDPSILSGPNAVVSQADDVVKAAAVHEDAVGANLIGTAVEIDRLATLAMAKLAPNAASVATSAQGAINGYLVQFVPKDVTTPTESKTLPAATPAVAFASQEGKKSLGVAVPAPLVVTPEETEYLATLKRKQEEANTYSSRAKAQLAAFNNHVDAFNAAQHLFDAAAQAYRPTSAPASCVVASFGGATALAIQGGSPVTLSAGGKAVFVLYGGVGYPRPLNVPEAIKMTPTWFGSTTKIEIEVSDAKAMGPWDMMFTDNAQTPTMLVIKVQRPAH